MEAGELFIDYGWQSHREGGQVYVITDRPAGSRQGRDYVDYVVYFSAAGAVLINADFEYLDVPIPRVAQTMMLIWEFYLEWARPTPASLGG